MEIDLKQDNVKVLEFTAGEVNSSIACYDSYMHEAIGDALDDAQRAVFIDKHKEFYLVVKITKE